MYFCSQHLCWLKRKLQFHFDCLSLVQANSIFNITPTMALTKISPTYWWKFEFKLTADTDWNVSKRSSETMCPLHKKFYKWFASSTCIRFARLHSLINWEKWSNFRLHVCRIRAIIVIFPRKFRWNRIENSVPTQTKTNRVEGKKCWFV